MKTGVFDGVFEGAGILGLAPARDLAHNEKGGAFAVLEKENRIAQHQTRHGP